MMEKKDLEQKMDYILELQAKETNQAAQDMMNVHLQALNIQYKMLLGRFYEKTIVVSDDEYEWLRKRTE